VSDSHVHFRACRTTRLCGGSNIGSRIHEGQFNDGLIVILVTLDGTELYFHKIER
jgi:hypothetical protein